MAGWKEFLGRMTVLGKATYEFHWSVTKSLFILLQLWYQRSSCSFPFSFWVVTSVVVRFPKRLWYKKRMATNSVGQKKDTNKQQTHLLWKFFFFNGIIFVNDFLLDTDTADSFELISSKIGKNNFLTWAGFRHSVAL